MCLVLAYQAPRYLKDSFRLSPVRVRQSHVAVGDVILSLDHVSFQPIAIERCCEETGCVI